VSKFQPFSFLKHKKMKNYFAFFILIFTCLVNINATHLLGVGTRNFVENPDRLSTKLIPWIYQNQQELAIMMPTCPGNQTINLGPGLCSRVVNYSFGLPPLTPKRDTFMQNVDTSLINSTVFCPSGPTSYKRTFYNSNWTDLTIDQIRLGVYESVNNPIVTIRFTNTTGSIVYGSGIYNLPNIAIPNGRVLYFAPSGTIKIPSRVNFVMEVISSAPGVSSFKIGRNNVGNTIPASEAAISGCAIPNISGPVNANSVVFGCTATPDDYRIVNTSTPPLNLLNSGSSFPVGTSNMSYAIYEPTVSTPTLCSFQITLNEFVSNNTSLACNDLVQVSLDDKCEMIVTPDMLLEGNHYGCYDKYTVQITGLNGQNLGNKVTKANLGQTLKTRITAPNGNSCWGEIFVQDKLGPVLQCGDIYATCAESLEPGTNLPSKIPVIANIANKSLNTEMKVIDIPVGNIPGSTINDLDVYLNIEHERISDIAAEIVSPDGIVVPLFLRQTGCSGKDLSASFDQQAAGVISCSNTNQPAISGRIKSAGSLSLFNGKPLGGIWKVRIYDLDEDIDGTVEDVHLIFGQSGGKVSFPFAATSQVTSLGDRSYRVLGLDSCSAVHLTYEDTLVRESCTDSYAQVKDRCWTARDAAGNISRCCQRIYVYRNSLSALVFPPNYDGTPGNRPPLSCEVFGDSIPSVDTTGVPEGDFCGKVQVFSPVDVKIDICPKSYKLLRTFKVVDWCTGTVIVHNQIIKVMDNKGPELECPPNVTISTDDYTCSSTYTVPRPKITKECSGAMSYKLEHLFDEVPFAEFGVAGVNQLTGTITGLPLGSNTIRWIVTDSCGNADTCSFKVLVRDDDRPSAVCDIFTVASITGGGKAIVLAETFDDGSTDNCGILKFEARKMSDSCGFGTVDFTPTVEFCCKEVNTSVMVEMRVTDVNGNSNTCMVEVKVHDKLPPYITKCPADITLECQANYRDTSITGWPTYVDNCAVDSVWYKDTDSISQCGTGVVTRLWTVKDKQNLRHSCVQVITLIDSDPFYVNRYDPFDPNDDIVWPKNYFTPKCLAQLDPKNLPDSSAYPKITDDSCSLVAAHYKDQVFKFADGACEKILRTWTVIDWCTYKEAYENHHNEHDYIPGKYEYIQIIKLNNDVPPQFEFACIDRIIPSYGECSETVKFNMTAIDDCPEGNDSIRWRYELYTENGIVPIAIVNSRFFERTLTNGIYRVKWIIEDKCGNQAICEHKLTLVESKKPTPYCHTSLTTAVMNNNGSVEIWAKDYDRGGYDNCTHQDSILFTFFDALPVDTMLYREHYFKEKGKRATKAEYEAGNAQIWKPLQKSSGMFFDCSDIPNGKSQQLSLNVTLTDRAGNQDYCTIHLVLQDNSGVCPDSDQIVAGISGRVTINTLGKIGTDVIIESNAPEASKTIRTDAGGQYSFNALPVNYNYTVRIEDDRDILNGVTTLDLVMIQRHILGIEEFNDAKKTIAADIDNSQKITAADLVAMRKVILGITNSFPNSQKSWRFVTSDFIPAGNISPFPYNEKYEFKNLTEVRTNQNFFAIKIGDINHSAKVNVNESQTEPRSNKILTLETEVKKVSGSDEILIPVYSGSFGDLLGYQFTMHFDHKNLDFLEVIPGAVNVTEQNFGFQMLDKGMIPTSWNSGLPVKINTSEPLFTLKFRNKGKLLIVNDLALSSTVTAAEAYDVDFRKMPVKLSQRTKDNVATTYELKQNVPNPFNESSQISFLLPESAFAKLTITDVAGKVIKVIEKAFDKGENHVLINKAELGATGILIYKLESGSFTDTKKMILLE
jgi:hypothetical protein